MMQAGGASRQLPPPKKYPFGQILPGQVDKYTPQMLAVYIQYKLTYKKMYIPQVEDLNLRPSGAQKPSD